jgi:hypothetical protein
MTLALPMAAQAAEPVSVMIVGVFHMSNPGRDLHDMHADDMLSPKRQSEIGAITDAFRKFHPTVIATEWPADVVIKRYGQYLAGTLAPSRNEVVQLGFRLAKAAGLKSVAGIDVDGDFPYETVDTYAKAHGMEKILAAANADVATFVDQQNALLANGTVAGVLRYMNDPAEITRGQDFYRTTLLIGGGTEQPGAELLTAWYSRNFKICANLVQLAKPGDHVVVFYGAGHAFLLRQCVSEMPGYKLIETNDYLPK